MNVIVWTMLVTALVLAWTLRADSSDDPHERFRERSKSKDDLTKR